MTESEVLKQAATYGIGGLIAIFMFLLYRRDLKDQREQAAARDKQYRDDIEDRGAEYKEHAERMAEIVINNTRVLALHEATNAQLARAVESLAKEEGQHGRRK